VDRKERQQRVSKVQKKNPSRRKGNKAAHTQKLSNTPKEAHSQ